MNNANKLGCKQIALSRSAVSLTAQTYSKKHMERPCILTITHAHSFSASESLGCSRDFFLAIQLLSSNATTDVLKLMLFLILRGSCFFIPLSSVTERKPSKTFQTTGGLCANMIRANRDCQTTNKDRARQKETFRKSIIGKQKHGKGVK